MRFCLSSDWIKSSSTHRVREKLSNNNNAVVKPLELYCFSPDAYFDDITPVNALVRALSSANAVVWVDNRSEPSLVLPLLQKLEPIRFEKANEDQILTSDIKTFD